MSSVSTICRVVPSDLTILILELYLAELNVFLMIKAVVVDGNLRLLGGSPIGGLYSTKKL